MNEIFIVIEVDYDDYSINGVFSTLDKARCFIENCSPDADVESYRVDEFENFITRTCYRVDMPSGESGTFKACDLPDKDTPDTFITNYDDGSFWVSSYVSKAHARELALAEQERRLRENK